MSQKLKQLVPMQQFLEVANKNGYEVFTSEEVASYGKDFIEKSLKGESNRGEFLKDVTPLMKSIVADENGNPVTMYYRKAIEGESLLKARSGVYADTPENRRLKRVGQKYGSDKQPEQEKEGKDKKGEDNQEQKKTNATPAEELKAVRKVLRGVKNGSIELPPEEVKKLRKIKRSLKIELGKGSKPVNKENKEMPENSRSQKLLFEGKNDVRTDKIATSKGDAKTSDLPKGDERVSPNKSSKTIPEKALELINKINSGKFRKLSRNSQKKLLIDSAKHKDTMDVPKLSSKEEDIVDRYTSIEYRKINEQLRSGKLDRNIKEVVHSLDKIISNNVIKNDIIVYRGTDGKDYGQDRAFISTSLDPSHAYNFADGSLKAYLIPKGTNGLYVGGGEDEFILPRGIDLSLFEIKG